MTRPTLDLIAVSGLRVYNERLVRLGVTLPGFVERARTPEHYDVACLECPEFDPAVLEGRRFDLDGRGRFQKDSRLGLRPPRERSSS